MSANSFDARSTLQVGDESYEIFRLDKVEGSARLPYSLKVLLENLLRTEDGANITADHIRALGSWDSQAQPSQEIQFTPARVIMQDFTGVPCVVDLATMREAVKELGGDPAKVNPLSPAELVIDHSVIADKFGTADAFKQNVDLEYGRNKERYQFLRWGQTAFDDFKVVPPGTGIVHQVNIEHLARVVMIRDGKAYPDTLVGTDSHTTMVNGLGVLGWGVGGIEAEAAMLGQPVSMLIPRVVGFKLTGELQPGTTATDLVLTITEMLREHGVVGKFVEFYGEGVAATSLANRATIGNMSPEFGSTAAIFPIDDETLNYLRLTGRSDQQVALVEAYAKEQGLWLDPAAEPDFSEKLELDLSTVVPSIAGPKRPQDRIELSRAAEQFAADVLNYVDAGVTGGDDRKAGVPQQEQPHGVQSPVDEASAQLFRLRAPAYGSDDAERRRPADAPARRHPSRTPARVPARAPRGKPRGHVELQHPPRAISECGRAWSPGPAVDLQPRTYTFFAEFFGALTTRSRPFSRWTVALVNSGEPMAYSPLPITSG
ncbi:Aconitate hydratase A OS=Streptomyces fumanus OX=67302 GN=GCM10018772_39060 PE=3 SV=1 [Streptomyces fumanus]